MYESLLNYPNSLFGEFERLRRELDDAFGVSGLPGSIRSVAAGSTARCSACSWVATLDCLSLMTVLLLVSCITAR